MTEGPARLLVTSSSASRDLTSLAERFGALLAVRVGLAGAVLLAVAVSGREMGVGFDVIGPLTAAYLGIGLATEGLRRAATVRAVNVQNVMLLIDALYLALVVAPTGGPHSELMFLFYVHLIAVTLLGTHRTGVRVAFWDSFLFLLIYTFSLRTEISRRLGATVSQPPGRQVALSIIAFWLVALCTAFFSSVNERELRRSKAELRVLAEMGAELERSGRSDEIVEVLLAKATEAFGFSRAVVLLNESATTTALASGHPAVTLSAPIEPDRVVRRAWTERGAVLVRALDAHGDPLLASLLPDAHNIVVLPLSAEGEPLGAFAAERGGPFGVKLPVRTVTMLAQFTAHAALAIRNARLLAEVERLAKLDGLTGLANRRVFEAALTGEVRRAQRTGDPLSLVVFDVDHFKQVNDTLGHQAGDAVLRHIGEVLRADSREIDLVARYGGEEFAVILPVCALESAVHVAERMRHAVAQRSNLEGISVSAGVASLPTNASTGDDLIRAADDALYRSKRNGRDRATASRRGASKSQTGGPPA